MMFISGWDKQETHAKLLCSLWPVARVSFFTERIQYQAIWMRMNNSVICILSTLRARVVLFCSPVIQLQSSTHITRGFYWSAVQSWQGTHMQHLLFIPMIRKGSVFSWTEDDLFFDCWKCVSSLTQQNRTKKKAQELESLEISTFSRNSKPLDLHITGDIKEKKTLQSQKKTLTRFICRLQKRNEQAEINRSVRKEFEKINAISVLSTHTWICLSTY